MKLITQYSCKIKHYNSIFKETVRLYREAVDYFIDVCLREWNQISAVEGSKAQWRFVEKLCITASDNVAVYPFDKEFYKFPIYLRRAAIAEAIGKVSSYKSNLANWEISDSNTRGKAPGFPKAGHTFPALYKDNMYKSTDSPYEFKIKVFTRNTWDWITVQLRKSDVDYINHRCTSRKQLSPTLQKRGKQWYLDFPFEERKTLNNTLPFEQTVIAVDLGLNNTATCVAMCSDGTVLGRHFLKLSREYDCLNTSLNRIKKVQQHGARKMSRLWAKAKGINDNISVKTANFIVDTAILYNADAIVMEHLDLTGKKHGSKKQHLHHWKAQYVQQMVVDKAHRLGMHIARVCAWNTSRLAYDGSGKVLRGKDAKLGSYSLCKFATGKVYNCDLNASYNIGARYFIRELLKSYPETERLDIEAKVPQCSKRSTCTWIDLINLNAVLAA